MGTFDTEKRQKAFLDDPLYSEYNLDGVEEKDLASFFWNQGTVDAFCSDCQTASVFKIKNPVASYDFLEKVIKFPKSGLITVELQCTRHPSDNAFDFCRNELLVCFKREPGKLIKIGQYPSKADLDFQTLDDAFKELEKNYRIELGTAIGLISHGVGIGSFVYLRRIFEHLIEEAHEKAHSKDAWNEEKYSKSRMTEKIELLAEFLPSRLVKSRQLYGILSKGIHELSEEECIEQFPLLRQAIQLILKERHENKEYEAIANSLS